MDIWEADFYRRPLQNTAGDSIWELVLCSASGDRTHTARCPQPGATATWLTQQLQHYFPAEQRSSLQLRVFRPQSLNLLEAACLPLGIALLPTRRTPALKQFLHEQAKLYPTLPEYVLQPYQPIALELPPPAPLAENLWGDRWQFATLAAGDLVDAFSDRPIPILQMPESLLPLSLGLASTVAIPGVVIEAGRRSRQLAQWIEQAQPVALTYNAGPPGGVILSAGLIDRWILATFEDADVAAAGQAFEQRKQASQNLHFLLVQPDETGMTYSGFWLLRDE
jgi:hypothetical protein